MAYFDRNGSCCEENTCRTERMYIHQSSHLYLFSKSNLFSSLSLYLLSGKVWQQQQHQQPNSKFKNIVAEVQKIRTRNMKYSSIELWLAYHSAVASCSLILILPVCEILSGSFYQPHHCLPTGSSWKSEGCCHGLPGLWLALQIEHESSFGQPAWNVWCLEILPNWLFGQLTGAFNSSHSVFRRFGWYGWFSLIF